EKDINFKAGVQLYGGEPAQDFEERVIETYTSIINHHLIKPHRELMNSIATANASTLISTPVERLKTRPRAASNNLDIPGQILEPRSPTRTNLVDFSVEPQLSAQNSQSQIATTLLRHSSVAEHPHQSAPQHPTLRPKMKPSKVLIVSHGGWIQELMSHLTQELGFTLLCDDQHGFPKNTGVYQFSIVKIWKEDGDYEWEGRISLMNCVSHFSGLSKKLSKDKKNDRKGQSGKNMARTPNMLRKSGSNPGFTGLANSALQLAVAVSRRNIKGPIPPSPDKAKPKIKSLGW
ncbi:hypothetical protein HK096_001976, partial [Nowakowskiella sp. JEL0078]